MKKKIIPKNWHYAINVLPWKPFCTKDSMVIRREYSFTDSCKYEIDEKSCVNKLCGFSTGFHHNNSMRVGWTYDNQRDLFDLWLYGYNNGKLMKRPVCSVKANEQFSVIIAKNIVEDNIVYTVSIIIDNVKWMNTFNTEIPSFTPISYYLEPYFGGNTRAPHRMEIVQVE